MDKPVQDKDIKHILRIANTDLDGHKPIRSAITKIKGVGFAFANAIIAVGKLDGAKITGYLTEEEVKKIDSVLQSPSSYGIPEWMVNRRKDYEVGTDRHLVGTDLDIQKQEDVKRMQRVRSRRGMRHAWRLPLRGQRTRSNFRPNKGKVVGVKRRKNAKAGRV